MWNCQNYDALRMTERPQEQSQHLCAENLRVSNRIAKIRYECLIGWMYFKTLEPCQAQNFYQRLRGKVEKLRGNVEPPSSAVQWIQGARDCNIDRRTIWSLDEDDAVIRQQFASPPEELQGVSHMSENVPKRN